MKRLIYTTLALAMSLLTAGAANSESMRTPSSDAAGKQTGIFTPEVMWSMGRIGSQSLSPDGRTLLYTVTRYDVEANRGKTTMVALRDGVHTSLGEGVDARWSADGGRIHYIGGDGQIWSMAPDGSDAVQVSRVEGGVEGFGVAPSGDRLFYVKSVHVKGVRSRDLYKELDKSRALIYDDLMMRHWDYWDEGDYRHIFVASFDGRQLSGDRDIMEGEPWDAPLAPYFDMAEIAWNHAGTVLAYTCKKLAGTEYAVSTDSDIFLYDTASGTTRNICKESGAEAMPGYDKYPVFSPDDSRIAFTSMRRAGNESDKDRLFVWDSRTGRMSDLTAGFDYNAANLLWSGNDALYFIAPIEATHQLCRVDMKGRVKVLTSGDHDINAAVLAGGRMTVALTKITQATELFDVNLSDGSLTQVTSVNGAVYDRVKMCPVEKRWVTTTDGKRMLVWVILPPDFDPAKKYPALLYCQGGPQSVVSQFWSYRWNFQLMASQGYVVVAPNRRGLPSFGQEWLDQISGDYSGQNIRDYLSAIDDVAREPWVDADRLGCVGASYGGYSVFFLAGNHDKRFKAFIAHCGIYDFESMYGSTEELWFVNNDYKGSYWSKDPVAVRSYANSPHKFIEKWDTPILIFTGMKDYRIPYTQSLEAFTAARLMGIPSRLVAFEDENHQVFKPQNSLVWNREFFAWLDKYLKKEE